MLWKATATAEKEMQNMKHVWKRYLIVTAMTVVLGLSAGCGSAAEDTNNNQNNTQDENTPDGNENKNNTDGSQVPAGDNNGTSPDTNTDMNNNGTNGTNNNMNGATSGEGTVDENGNRLDENVRTGARDRRRRAWRNQTRRQTRSAAPDTPAAAAAGSD